MPCYLILAQSETTANALNMWLNLLGDEELLEGNPRRIVHDRPLTGGISLVDTYEMLARHIDIAAKGGESALPLNEVVVLVDSIRPGELNAVAESGWDNIVAMLILTFPEIRWHFGIFSGSWVPNSTQGAKESERIFFPECNHSLPALLDSVKRAPLLDPTGLRQWVRQTTVTALKNIGDSTQLPLRLKRAAAIDEEHDYARMHGYTAYRFGCRVDIVTNWSLMRKLFSCRDKPHGYWLLLEDMSLNFPDRDPNIHLLQLTDEKGNQQGRDHHCPQLDSKNDLVEDSSHRLLITTGQDRPGGNANKRNRAYLREKIKGRGAIIYKPACGMFDLWDEARLLRSTPHSRRRGNVAGFNWPPTHPAGGEGLSGHGAPGKLLVIAEALIRRATGMLPGANSVSQAIQGGVLATDALELISGRTPTAGIQALTLKHEFEVLAECQFSGVKYHIAVKPRFAEIQAEVKAISRWFHTKQRKDASLNARMHILGRLVKILRNHGQFDEEQLVLNHVRHLQNSLWMRQAPGGFLAWPFLRYTEKLLSSFSMYGFMLVCWFMILCLLFLPFFDGVAAFGNALLSAAGSFFSIGLFIPVYLPLTRCVLFNILIFFSTVSGFFHLGIFISHLYSILSRR